MSDGEPAELLAPAANEPGEANPPAPDPDRLDKVVTLIVSGATERQVRAVIEKQFPGVDAEPLIVHAMLFLAETGDAEPLAIKGWCMEATRAIYRKALTNEEPDLELALKAVNQLHRIAGDK